MIYQNRQLALWIFVMMFVFIVYLIWIASTIDSWWFIWLWSTFTILLGALFWCLEVKVNADEILLSYGFGFINKKIQRQQILQVEVVRNAWWYGLGIRLTPHGWMWSISGLDAIELTYQDGNKFRIGTNQPQGLYQALITGIC
ncbi:hypothetical protein CMK19_06725 [Candidatus Poribacteria bacterium]|nr:hypothetical protein [Candidatus Poribacteria bacterium]MEE2909256.1 hypothetical protein [Candidatus Poribacteria bacterium]|tara:strand:+ start:207 stop:635 length:429 start_codon:yes stop_codon:yes gene_type:complete